MKTNENNIQPGKAWYLVALILFCLPVAALLYFFIMFFSFLLTGTQFIVPGPITVSVDSPSKYTLWNETSIIFNGKFYKGSPTLPNEMNIKIHEISTGSPLNLKPSPSGKETSGSTERYSMGSIYFDKKGQYQIEVSGNFADRVFLLRRSVFLDTLTAVTVYSLLIVVGWIGAPVLAIIVFTKRSAAIKQLPTKDLEREHISIGALSEQEERTWAMICHLGALMGYFMPLGNILCPLIIWLIKKEESPLIEDQAKESLNFQISITIYFIISLFLTLLIIGVFLLIALSIFNLVIIIIAGIKANSGVKYRYPLSIRFVK